MKKYRITRTINNSVSFASDGEKEVIICGKGISFGKKSGDEIPSASVDKVFTIVNDRQRNMLVEMVESISFQYVELAIRIVELYEKTYRKKLNQMMIVSLSDHIENAVDNMKKGIKTPNEMLNEIKRLYLKEYRIAQEGLDLIEKETGVRLPDEEAGFIVLHYLNSMGKGPSSEARRRMQFIGKLIGIVEGYFQITANPDSFYYQRFITHLTFFTSRLFNDEGKPLEKDDFVYRVIRNEYPEIYKCVQAIGEFIEHDYGKTITDEEKGYLIIHIHGLLKEKGE